MYRTRISNFITENILVRCGTHIRIIASKHFQMSCALQVTVKLITLSIRQYHFCCDWCINARFTCSVYNKKNDAIETCRWRNESISRHRKFPIIAFTHFGHWQYHQGIYVYLRCMLLFIYLIINTQNLHTLKTHYIALAWYYDVTTSKNSYKTASELTNYCHLRNENVVWIPNTLSEVIAHEVFLNWYCNPTGR